MMSKILVVDDNSNERNGLCRLLEQAGFEVRSAADGDEALQKVKSNDFDLLLVDIWMPHMDGLELLARLPQDSRPRTIVITGDESPVRSLREKAYLFIPKPFHPQEVVQQIRDSLETPRGPDSIRVLSADPNCVELRFPCELHAAIRVEKRRRTIKQKLAAKNTRTGKSCFPRAVDERHRMGRAPQPGGLGATGLSANSQIRDVPHR
jgi:DNA-binding NtrC family response regulator